MLIITACGYHLAGTGRGVIPEDVQTLAISASDHDAGKILQAFQAYVREHSKDITVTNKEEADAALHITDFSETYNPITFDRQGVASTYRLKLSGQLSLTQSGKTLWNSGNISVYDDVFSVGDPVSIEASKTRSRQDLQREWVREAWLRLASGF